MNKIRQVWVMWSADDLGFENTASEIAYELWETLAKANFILVYGAEKDGDSLSATAARWAKSAWWTVMWITYGQQPDIWNDMMKYTDTIVNTWMDRGGWREYVLVSSCDALISVWGGSWTLNELTIGYQKKIPIVNMKWTWWWSDRLADTYIDERYKTDPDRFICKWANTPAEAVDYLLKLNERILQK